MSLTITPTRCPACRRKLLQRLGGLWCTFCRGWCCRVEIDLGKYGDPMHTHTLRHGQ